MQEIVLAREALVMCGSKSIDWSLVADLMESCEARIDVNIIMITCLSKYCSSEEDSVLHRNARDHIQSITALRQGAGFRHYPHGDATGVLRLFRNSESTDPRDKLWGFVGCFDWQNDFYSPPDYQRPIVDVYTEVAKVAFKWSGWLYMLGEAGRSKQGSKSEFPSWVPDWSYRLAGLSLMVLGEGSKLRREDPLILESMEPLFCAGGQMIDTGTDGLFPAPGVLSTKVKSVGIIASRTRHPGSYSNAHEVNMSILRGRRSDYDRCVALAEASLAVSEAKDTATSIRATVAHTLVAGLNAYDNKIPSNVGTYLPHWVEHSILKNEKGWLLATLSDIAVSIANAAAVDRALCMVYTSGLHYFTILNHKFFALVPTVVEASDVVVVVNGAPVACVVRKREDDDQTFELVGEAYVYGFMKGELEVNHQVPWEDMWLV